MGFKNLLGNENDLNNHDTQNPANRQLALPQAKTTTYESHSIRNRTTEHWYSVQNKLTHSFPMHFFSTP